MLSLYDYESIVLLDKNENPVYYMPDDERGKKQLIHNYSLKNELNIKKSIITDIHIIDTLSNQPELDLIVPLIESTESDTVYYGYMIFEINPEKYLYPLVQSWPTASQTSETILMKEENNQAVYLNELKYRENAVLRLKENLTDKIPLLIRQSREIRVYSTVLITGVSKFCLLLNLFLCSTGT